MKALVISYSCWVTNQLSGFFLLLYIILTSILKIVQLLPRFMYVRGFILFATTLAHADANRNALANAANQHRAWRRVRRLAASKV